MSLLPSSMITQADLFARACSALDCRRFETLADLALEGRSRKPTQAEAAAWAAVLSAASDHLDEAREAVQQAVALDADNDALRHVRLSVMRLVATARVEQQKAMARERRSIFARMRRE